MSKKNKNAVDFKTVSPALVQEVENVLAEAAKHKYSASRVYSAHNQVMGKTETPEVCASCLKKRAEALRKWYGEYTMHQANESNDLLNAEGQALTNVPRETFTDLDGIYGYYAATIVGAPTETTDELEGEVAGIIAIMEKHADELAESENDLLTSRLGDIKAQQILDTVTAPNVGNYGTDEVKGTTPVKILDDQEVIDAAKVDLLALKNKKGESFSGTFNSEDGVNGQLLDAEGVSFKPGTYSTETGDSYAVQPGGKATYKNDVI